MHAYGKPFIGASIKKSATAVQSRTLEGVYVILLIGRELRAHLTGRAIRADCIVMKFLYSSLALEKGLVTAQSINPLCANSHRFSLPYSLLDSHNIPASHPGKSASHNSMPKRHEASPPQPEMQIEECEEWSTAKPCFHWGVQG